MENNINHPNEFGHTLFADSLMALFDREPWTGRSMESRRDAETAVGSDGAELLAYGS